MDDLPTPETDAAPKLYFGDNRPSMETECVSTDFARNLERRMNTLLNAAIAVCKPLFTASDGGAMWCTMRNKQGALKRVKELEAAITKAKGAAQ